MKKEEYLSIIPDVKEFLQINLFSNSYSGLIKHNYEFNGRNEIDFSIQEASLFLKAQNDVAIFKEREKLLNARTSYSQGDLIELPDGQLVTISHVHEKRVQTSGNGGSLHLHSGGGVSRSGGLDSGLLKSALIPTKRTHPQNCWIFHEGRSGAHRGVHFPVFFKVFTVKDGTDLSGVPQVKALAKKNIRDKAETITRINGNGQEYTLPIPEIHLQLTDKFQSIRDIKHGQKLTLHGLDFSFEYYDYQCQPMTLNSINHFLQKGNFNAVFYNNCSNQNVLMLSPANGKNKKRTSFLE